MNPPSEAPGAGGQGRRTTHAVPGASHGLAVHRVAPGAMAERAVTVINEYLTSAAPDELAVLARVNSALLPVQVALSEAGIGHSAPLDRQVLARTGVRTALAYLRLGLDLERIARDDLFDTINRPARKVKSAVQPLLPRGRTAIRQLEQLADSLDPTHRERFTDYLGDLRGLEAAITDGADTARCLWIVRNRIGLGEAMDALDASRSRPEGSSHGDDLDALEQLAALQPDPAAFAAWLADRLRVPADPGGITLSTVHRVKGMEWPHVIVFAANRGLFPHRLADDDEEERRVFHVALTRCQRSVAVVADRARCSPFVDELTTPPTRVAAAGGRDASDGAGDGAHAPDAQAAMTRGDGDGELSRRRATPPPRDAERHPDGAVVAAPGIRIGLPGGFTATVVTATREHATARLDAEPVDLRLDYGTPLQLDDASAVLGPPAASGGGSRRGSRDGGGSRDRTASREGSLLPGDGDDDAVPVDAALFEALKAWRGRVAATNGVPAYLVFHDRHLQVLAGRRPRTLQELAGCPGIGPTKLERYGDDLLDVIDAHPG